VKQTDLTYQEQLTDVKWLKKRDKILSRDHYVCTKCGYVTELQVHHLYYIVGKKAWQYPNSALITLCSKCHKKWHDKYELVIRYVDRKKSPIKPPIKRSRKNLSLRRKVNKYIIPLREYKVIWWEIRRLSIEDREKYLLKISKQYKLKKDTGK
jgi:hypothetical protein